MLLTDQITKIAHYVCTYFFELPSHISTMGETHTLTTKTKIYVFVNLTEFRFGEGIRNIFLVYKRTVEETG